MVAHRDRESTTAHSLYFDRRPRRWGRVASRMAHTDTNHRANDTSTPVLNGGRIGDSARVFSKAGSAIQIFTEDHHASCEAASLCTRFLVSLSHQMRTQLNSIVSATE